MIDLCEGDEDRDPMCRLIRGAIMKKLVLLIVMVAFLSSCSWLKQLEVKDEDIQSGKAKEVSWWEAILDALGGAGSIGAK